MNEVNNHEGFRAVADHHPIRGFTTTCCTGDIHASAEKARECGKKNIPSGVEFEVRNFRLGISGVQHNFVVEEE